jgi:hypothetical protein
MSDVAIPGLAYAYANYGRWVSDCPRPWCTNAMQVERGQAMFECLGPDSCGRTAPIVWPPDPAAIEAILAVRPANAVRNWLVGETLTQLIEENAAHGFIPLEWVPAGGGAILQAVDEVVVGGTIMPAVEVRRALHAIES